MADRFNNRDNYRALRRSDNAMSQNGSIGGCCGSAENNSCNNNNISDNCKSLKYRLQLLDFSIIDTVLYLNAYPDSAEAMKYYKQLISERDELKRALAQSCNMPVTSFEGGNSESWDWISGPWPWDLAAN